MKDAFPDRYMLDGLSGLPMGTPIRVSLTLLGTYLDDCILVLKKSSHDPGETLLVFHQNRVRGSCNPPEYGYRYAFTSGFSTRFPKTPLSVLGLRLMHPVCPECT